MSRIRKVVKFVYPDWFIFPENQKVCRIRKSWQPWLLGLLVMAHQTKTSAQLSKCMPIRKKPKPDFIEAMLMQYSIPGKYMDSVIEMCKEGAGTNFILQRVVS